MKTIFVNGGAPLRGDIHVSGSKNAALPIIFACILTNGVSEIENLPDIGDVRVALSLLTSFGATVRKENNLTFIDTTNLSYSAPDVNSVSAIRASTYLIGSCLSRFGRCPIMKFGGCNFSSRPIDMHLEACFRLGARAEGELLLCNRLIGNEIVFDKASVGATVNALLLSASAEGETVIKGCAVEPHIDALIAFLVSCGAEISRRGRELHIVGKQLHSGKIKIIGDMIEAGSYLALSLMCGGGIRVLNAPISDMQAVIESLKNLGADISVDKSGCLSLSLGEANYLDIVATPYPGFPTDLQPVFAPLMAYCNGGKITDTVWQNRFGYLSGLSNFGVKSTLGNNSATIYKSNIHNGSFVAPDLRGGMAGLLCALCSTGQSEIYSAETILRGYEKLEEKLRSVGAEIKIVNH